MTRSALYRGTVMHARRDAAVRRRFEYAVYVAAIELDELASLHRERALFSHNARNVFALYDRDYAAGATDQRALLATHGLAAPARTRLVTNLRVCGYTFNPVSFFLGYDAAGALRSVVAEVNNTYGGRHRYVMGDGERLATRDPARVGFRVARTLFVSPFLHGDLDYELWFDAPLDGAHLDITMHVTSRRGERVFVARLAGTRAPLTDRTLVSAALRYPLMTAQVIGLIHLEAMKLRFLHGVPYRRPGPDHRPLPAEIDAAL